LRNLGYSILKIHNLFDADLPGKTGSQTQPGYRADIPVLFK